MYPLDIDELTEQIAGFYLDYAPFSFVQESPGGTVESAKKDIAMMLSRKSGRRDLVYNLTESIKTDMIPELPYDDTIQEFIDRANELIEHINSME